MRRLIMFSVISFALLASCQNYEEIKIGVMGPYTMVIPHFGQYMREAISLAVEEANEKNGVNGKQINLIYEDTQCINYRQAVAAMNKLKYVDGVKGILGPFCGTTNKIAGNFSTENNLFVISPGDNFGYTGKYKINTRYLISKEAELIAEYAHAQGFMKIAVLYYDNDWGITYKNIIKEYIESRGGSLVASEPYTFQNLDVRAQLTKIKQANPDALFIADTTQGELFTQVKELGITIPLLSEWEIEKEQNAAAAQGALEGVIYFMPKTKQTAFHKKFKDKYGKEPHVVHLDSYDAARLMIEAMRKCEFGGEFDNNCMVSYVISLQNYQGAGGLMTFNKERWCFDKPFVKKTVRNGEFVEVNSSILRSG